MKDSSGKKSPDGGPLVDFPIDATIVRQGDLGREMYVIHEGKVEITRTSGDGTTSLAVLEKGDFFGEMSLLEYLPRSATARALTDVKVVEVNAATFDRMLTNNPEITVRIMRKLSRRVRETDELLSKQSDLSGSSAPDDKKAEPVAAPAEARAPLCRLFHTESSSEFKFTPAPEATVGRIDPVTGIRPDIDLSGVDVERSSSRRHAKFLWEDDAILLVEDIGTTNGTFLNGDRIQHGIPKQVRSGDLVQFGLVELSFECR
jgi:CRP-like cAMP-binding protein